MMMDGKMTSSLPPILDISSLVRFITVFKISSSVFIPIALDPVSETGSMSALL
jgi:hypothetical protein